MKPLGVSGLKSKNLKETSTNTHSMHATFTINGPKPHIPTVPLIPPNGVTVTDQVAWETRSPDSTGCRLPAPASGVKNQCRGRNKDVTLGLVRIKGDRIHGLFSPILKNGLYIGVKTHLLGEMIHYDLLILGNICAFWEDDSTTQLYR